MVLSKLATALPRLSFSPSLILACLEVERLYYSPTKARQATNHVGYILSEFRRLDSEGRASSEDKKIILYYNFGVFFIKFTPLWKAAVDNLIGVLSGEAKIPNSEPEKKKPKKEKAREKEERDSDWRIFLEVFSRTCGFEGEESVVGTLLEREKGGKKAGKESDESDESEESEEEEEEDKEKREGGEEDGEEGGDAEEDEDVFSRLSELCLRSRLHEASVNPGSFRDQIWKVARTCPSMLERYTGTVVPKFLEIVRLWKSKIMLREFSRYEAERGAIARRGKKEGGRGENREGRREKGKVEDKGKRRGTGTGMETSKRNLSRIKLIFFLGIPSKSPKFWPETYFNPGEPNKISSQTSSNFFRSFRNYRVRSRPKKFSTRACTLFGKIYQSYKKYR
jgi:hypothetical protein